MSPKIIGFTATNTNNPNERANDILIIDFNKSQIIRDNKKIKPVYFKFIIFHFKRQDSLYVDFTIKSKDQRPTKSRFSLDQRILDNKNILRKNGDYYAACFTVAIPLVVSEGIVTCKMSLKQKHKRIDHATTYFAFRNIDNMRI